MKINLLDHSRKMAWGAVLAVGLLSLSFTARADEWDKKTKITIDEPMQIADTLLQPGTYTLRLYDSIADRHVVQIWNADETHMINTVLCNRTEKLLPAGKSQFTFYETPAGTAKALKKWYYPGDISGNEFAYPTHPQQLDTASTTTSTTTPTVVSDETNSTSTTTTATNTTPQPEPQPEPTPAPVATQPAEPEPAPVAAPEPTPAPVMDQDNSADRAATPAELPKTASPYPLFGFAGLVLAGLAGLLLTKRTA